VIGEGEEGIVIKTGDGYATNPKIASLLARFRDECALAGSVSIHEKDLKVDDYAKGYTAMLAKTMKNPKGLFMPVRFTDLPSPKYRANGNGSLTDGLRGDVDHKFNWLGFEGEHLEAVVDLQKASTVSKVTADFLQIQESWIFLPASVEVGVSADGVTYTTVATLTHTEPLERKDAFIRSFAAEFAPVQARYIKVAAKNIVTCPRWHPGYPGPAWIFTDEIVVE